MKKTSQLFDHAMDKNFHEFKEIYSKMVLESIEAECRKLNQKVTKTLARFDVVHEGISIPLDNPKIKDAHLFAIESDDDENLVLKFNIDGTDDEQSFTVPKEDEDFYKELQEKGLDKVDEKAKKKIAMALNDFEADVPVDKKDDSIERGTELDGDVELKMEADGYDADPDKPMFRLVGKNADGKEYKSPGTNSSSFLNTKKKELEKKGFTGLKVVKMTMEDADMSKLTGQARLQALKKLAEKKKLEASKKANEETDDELDEIRDDETKKLLETKKAKRK